MQAVLSSPLSRFTSHHRRFFGSSAVSAAGAGAAGSGLLCSTASASGSGLLRFTASAAGAGASGSGSGSGLLCFSALAAGASASRLPHKSSQSSNSNMDVHGPRVRSCATAVRPGRRCAAGASHRRRNKGTQPAKLPSLSQNGYRPRTPLTPPVTTPATACRPHMPPPPPPRHPPPPLRPCTNLLLKIRDTENDGFDKRETPSILVGLRPMLSLKCQFSQNRTLHESQTGTLEQ